MGDTKHTPTPWFWIKARTMYHLHTEKGYSGISASEKVATGEVMNRIVTACNAHDELVEALKFYANKDNWAHSINEETGENLERDLMVVSMDIHNNSAGHIARKALKNAGIQL